MESILTISPYLPILTTFISACFAWAIFARYRRKPDTYQLLWWGIGMVTDGPGLEGTATLAPPRSATAMSGPPGSAVTAWSAPLTIPRALAARTWENFACAGAGVGRGARYRCGSSFPAP